MKLVKIERGKVMKQNLVVLFGGQSTEHDISRRSVMLVLSHIDYSKYKVFKVGITKEGKWLFFDGDQEDIINDTWEEQGISAFITPDATVKSLIICSEAGYDYHQIDVVIPVLHGLYGEDGSIQGLLKLAGIPYVGCGILSSALSMDKFYTKLIVEPLGIRQANYVRAYKESYMRQTIEEKVRKELGYPVFVKPSNAGSSIGVSKVMDEAALHSALEEAFKYDRKVLIEESIVGREVECAVLGNFELKVSDVGEILSGDEFYDFDSKYNSVESKTVLRADIEESNREKIREYSAQIFKAVEGRGLARVDFFIEESSGEVVFNEINTMPGLTDISMYPMLFKESGINNAELINRLIELAIEITP